MIKKTITIINLFAVLVFQTVQVSAFEAPTPPESPNAPVNQVVEPTPPPEPEAPQAPTPSPEITQDSVVADLAADTNSAFSDTSNNSETSQPITEINQSESQSEITQTGSEASGNVGDTTISTGDLANSASLVTLANSNLSTDGSGSAGTSKVNSDNGASSDNNASVSLTNNNTNVQNNNAEVGNGLALETLTGQNTASANVGDSTILTGDANTTGTVITGLNTNLDGVSVSEFNIIDNHQGDIILDFGGSSCVSGCGGVGSSSAQNVNNGSGSDNNTSVDTLSQNDTFQTNNALLNNDVILTSDSGSNITSQNTGGDSTIKTGDANVVANVLSFLNNNLEGNVVLAVVNIFGDLVGDIILPEQSVANSGNGADSTNTGSINQSVDNTSVQTNDVSVDNNLLLMADTGLNDANRNTSGDSIIKTGDSEIQAQTVNVVNSNVDGGNWWLVIVNEAGQWIGKIFGSPDASNLAGSEGTEFVSGENGEITVINSGNGAASQNDASVESTVSNTTVQTNSASIVNNLNLSANTGGNKANNNTGGNNFIQTGDAKIIANLINFANNNITGGGKLVVTIINVFGSWVGDFVPPGMEKPKDNDLADESDLPQTGSNGNSQDSSITTGSEASENNSSETETEDTEAAPLKNISRSLSFKSIANILALSTEEPEQNDLIQSLATTEEGNDKSEKTLKVNLAWMMFLLPLSAAIVLVRRKYKNAYIRRITISE